MDSFRLDKLVCEMFGLTRKQAKKEISSGNVTVNGSVVRQSAEHCLVTDEIACGEKIGRYQRFYYIMMNKPKGVLSATADRKMRTAIDLLPEELFRKDLFVAGRLDKDTTGFLLLTNDGDFAHNILSPKNHIQKTYVARLEQPVKPSDVQLFAKGIQLKDFVCKPAILRPIGDCLAEIVVVEGKFHQIKRMFHSVDNEVLELHRKKMGELELDKSLLPGESRYISEDELKLLKGE